MMIDANFEVGQKVICTDDFDTFNQLKAGVEYEVEQARGPFLILRGVSEKLPESVRGYYASRFVPTPPQDATKP